MSDLSAVVAEHFPFLQTVSDEQASRKPAPESWSAKEILGHLIDSGVNNHARFVRASAEDGLSLPGYDQQAWVSVGGWQQRDWADLLALWQAYQLQLAHVIARLSADALAHRLSIGGGERVTLEFAAQDYVAHQLHHLAQIRERVG